jgi:hypothetical protein
VRHARARPGTPGHVRARGARVAIRRARSYPREKVRCGQIFRGGAGGFDTVADGQVDGLADNDNLGDAVAGAGDLNGDGFADIIVGVPFQAGSGSGQALIFEGGASPSFDGTADGVLNGQFGPEHFGASVD